MISVNYHTIEHKTYLFVIQMISASVCNRPLNLNTHEIDRKSNRQLVQICLRDESNQRTSNSHTMCTFPKLTPYL